MPLRESFAAIKQEWPAYRARGTVDKSETAYSLVTQEVPELLQSYALQYPQFTYEGSTGRGNVTAAPWVAAFDPRITTSATTGYYVVYLFSVDMELIYLTLAFGTTQFREQFGGTELALERMRDAAERLESLFRRRISPDLKTGPIDLRASRRDRLHREYESSAILWLEPYSLSDLPPEDTLRQDFLKVLEAYEYIASDPLTPNVQDLLEATVQAPADVLPEVRQFVPRPPPKKGSKGASSRRHSGVRRETQKVGQSG